MPGKVTIAIPTLNRAAYLRISLESALAQSYPDLEVLVSNNACTDETASLLASISDPRLRVIAQPTKLSMVENWNACVAAATGEYFLMLSDDDLLEPEAIAELVRRYEEAQLPPESIGFVYCRGRIIDQDGKVLHLGSRAPTEIEDAGQLVLNYFHGKRTTWACTILFRTRDIAAGYTPKLPLGCEAAQWIQAVARHGKAIYVDRILASYRKHTSLTAITAIETWRQDNAALAEYAIEALRASGRGSDRTYDEIRRAVDRLTLRFTSSILQQQYAGKKLAFLKAHRKYWREFASLYGLDCLARGFFQFYAPNFVLHVGRVRRLLLGQE